MSSCAIRAAASGLTLASLLCAACSGGGGSSGPSTPPAASPRVSLSASPTAIPLGQSATLSWSVANATACTASGAWSGSGLPLSGTQSVTPPFAGVFTYVLTCDGVATSAAVVAQTPATTPPPTGDGALVSVVVCFPGSGLCQTVERVRVETASSGLRLLASALDASIALPAVVTEASLAVGECAKRSGGYLWGSVRLADVTVAGQVARGLPLQLVGDAGSLYGKIPADCSNAGSNLGSTVALEANGILGLGPLATDCGTACASQVIPGTYYACTATGCTGTVLPVASQVANPATFIAAGG